MSEIRTYEVHIPYNPLLMRPSYSMAVRESSCVVIDAEFRKFLKTRAGKQAIYHSMTHYPDYGWAIYCDFNSIGKKEGITIVVKDPKLAMEIKLAYG
jgi:hypothetical protein